MIKTSKCLLVLGKHLRHLEYDTDLIISMFSPIKENKIQLLYVPSSSKEFISLKRSMILSQISQPILYENKFFPEPSIVTMHSME